MQSEAEISAMNEKILRSCEPHLQRLNIIFGPKAKLTLMVMADGCPGAMLFSTHEISTDELIAALKHTAEVTRETQ